MAQAPCLDVACAEEVIAKDTGDDPSQLPCSPARCRLPSQLPGDKPQAE